MTDGATVVVYQADGKVSIVPMDSLTERAYGLGRVDQLVEDMERLRRGLPKHWFNRVVEILEEPE